MENLVKPLIMLEKLAGNGLWKMSGNFLRFPQSFISRLFSTACVEKVSFLLWKTLRKMWKLFCVSRGLSCRVDVGYDRFYGFGVGVVFFHFVFDFGNAVEGSGVVAASEVFPGVVQ